MKLESNELPRRKQRGIKTINKDSRAASGGKLNPLWGIKKPSRLFIILLTLTLTLMVTGNSAATDDELSTVIKRLQKKYETITTLTAGFTQEVFSNSLQSSEETRGQVSFKKPGMMRWDYSQGGQIISNGMLVWVYDPELAQVMETRIDPAKPGISTDFLSGIAVLERDFDIKLLNANAAGFKLSLVPKRPMGNTAKLIVEIDRTFLLKKTIAIDNFNNETRVTFHGIDINTHIPNKEFEYKTRPGIKIIRP